MKTTAFIGNFFEIGRQQGQIYKANGMNLDGVKIDRVLFQKQLKIYKKSYPEILNEFEGMAYGGDFDTNKLICNFITGEIFYYKDYLRLDKACTIFGYKSKNKLYVGRNYDWSPIYENIVETYKLVNSERNSFIAITDMGADNTATSKKENFFYNADDAINDKGLYIGINFAFADKWTDGISSIHMTKLIAETCETVDDALTVFEKVPLCCPKNFFIADKYGDMAVVEHTSKKFKVIFPKNNVLIQTNHYVDEGLAKEDTVLKRVPYHNTFIRYYETLQKIAFEKDKFSSDSVRNILRRKGGYTFQNFSDVKTIWTLALDMTNQKYRIYTDAPKKDSCKEITI